MIADAVASALLLAGAVFAFVAAVGVMRFPDVLTRLHAAAKAGVLGAGFVLCGVAFGLGTLDAWLRAGASLLFVVLTAPVASHAVGRAAYLSRRVRLSPETVVDQWGGRRARSDSRRAFPPRKRHPVGAPESPLGRGEQPAGPNLASPRSSG